ncbi:uncharacterized protein V6R79_019826 [Siganus canaliculatus]
MTSIHSAVIAAADWSTQSCSGGRFVSGAPTSAPAPRRHIQHVVRKHEIFRPRREALLADNNKLPVCKQSLRCGAAFTSTPERPDTSL